MIYPVVRELPADLETPLSVYLKLRGLGPSFLLESVEGGEHLARYSMIGTQPRAVLRAWSDRVVLEEEGRWRELPVAEGDPLDVLQALMPRYAPGADEELPRFAGGAVGYLSYDAVRWFERVPARAPDTLRLPEAAFLLCDQVVLYDHVASRLMIVAHAESDNPHHPSRQAAEATIAQIVARLERPLPRERVGTGHIAVASLADQGGYQSAFEREAFEEAVKRAKAHIAAGDIFQVVPSRRAHRRTSASPLAIYRALRRINPSPYMFYLELPDGLRLIGSSPEVLVRVEGDLVETRPLAGTRPRGATEAEDKALAEELLADPKERAEHVMLVDLARNDLGRVCAYGTVQTPMLMEIERYSHVMHIVSSVQGTLAEGRDAVDVPRACFPAGTVSGAPK
ncbi:MAG: anthranilate synthase component I family protein, partial [Anaerolineae bacterium]